MLTFSLVLAIAAVLDGPPTDTPAEIDRLLSIAHQANKVSAVDQCSDDAFVRRVTLDLVGRIPTRGELHEFRAQAAAVPRATATEPVSDTGHGRRADRAALIDRLLSSREFSQFWSEVWTDALVGYPSPRFQVSREALRGWIENAIEQGLPYDQMVRRLIAAEGDSAFDGPVNFLLRHRQEPAVKVSRAFLGVRLDCARCHDHPFDHWTRDDFDRFSAFFGSVRFQPISPRNIRLTEVPRDAEEQNRPRFLTGATPQTSRWRDELALFVTTCKPFARNFANRVWYQLMGRGIVEPPDNFIDGAAVVPELVDYLAAYARTTKFDLHKMIRAICNSQAYGRESGHAGESEHSVELFASYGAKPMTDTQLIRSIEIGTGLVWSPSQRRQYFARVASASLDEDRSLTWDYRDAVQSVMTELVREHSVVDSSVTSIYETILSRRPTDEEIKMCRGRENAQIAFALLNSNEFRFCH